MSSVPLAHATLSFLTEGYPVSNSSLINTCPKACITVSTQMQSNSTDFVVRPAASIISVHMGHLLQQAADRSERRSMSAEPQPKGLHPQFLGMHSRLATERDGERFLLMYFGRSIHYCLSKQRFIATRRDGIKDLSQRKVPSTHGLEVVTRYSSVSQMSDDVFCCSPWLDRDTSGLKVAIEWTRTRVR